MKHFLKHAGTRWNTLETNNNDKNVKNEENDKTGCSMDMRKRYSILLYGRHVPLFNKTEFKRATLARLLNIKLLS